MHALMQYTLRPLLSASAVPRAIAQRRLLAHTFVTLAVPAMLAAAATRCQAVCTGAPTWLLTGMQCYNANEVYNIILELY
jgi:hypothetical protein